jgi:hypothetical protein
MPFRAARPSAVTTPDSPSPRAPRRLGLFAPFILALLLAAAVAADWEATRRAILERMTAARTAGAIGNLSFGYEQARLYGFPFRLDLNLVGPRLAEPSGWGLSATRLKAEAYLFSPTHWVVVAPEGVTLTRRGAGPLVIEGKALRASVSDLAARPPRISVEGLDLTFSTPPGARPFPLLSAAGLHVHTRAGPGNQGALYFGIEDGRPIGVGRLADLAGGSPVSLTVDGIWNHSEAMTGPDWPAMLRRWSRAGGRFDVRRLAFSAGPASISVTSGALGADPGGRLSGDLSATLVQAPRLSAAASGKPPPPEVGWERTIVLPLDFQRGRARLGPLVLGRAPRLF